MKIVHICLCGPVTDGFSYQDNLLPKYHKKMGMDVSFITSRWIFNEQGDIERYEKTNYVNNDGVYMIRLNNRNGEQFKDKFKHFIGLTAALNKEYPDILFVHGVQFLEAKEVVNYVKKNRKVKMYVDNHADFSNSGRRAISRIILHGVIWRHMAQILNPYVTKFYGVLPARVDWLESMYKLPANKCELLVMGADDEKVKEARDPRVRNEIRRKYGIKADDFLIMTGGKIDTAKRQTLLLMQAVSKIQNQKVKLIVFGSVVPEMKDEVEALVEPEKVQYIGWVQSDQSYNYFGAADLAVFPGRHSVFWEQVAGLGVPMICKYWDGTTHVNLGGNVEFLYKDSVEEIYNVVSSIIEEPKKYEKMKRVAEEKGMLEFSYENIAKKSITEM